MGSLELRYLVVKAIRGIGEPREVLGKPIPWEDEDTVEGRVLTRNKEENPDNTPLEVACPRSFTLKESCC